MKKLTAILLVLAMLLAFAACTGSKDDTTTEGKSEPAGPASALALLEEVWKTYAEDEKFAAAGGDGTEENSRSDAPGKFGISDAETLDSMLGFPKDSVALIDDAASLMHMMNQNTFTCGAYHVANSSDVDALAAKLKDNILARRWMCGFPEKLVIVAVGDYVLSYFGNGETVDLFTAKLTAVYSDARQISDTPIE